MCIRETHSRPSRKEVVVVTKRARNVDFISVNLFYVTSVQDWPMTPRAHSSRCFSFLFTRHDHTVTRILARSCFYDLSASIFYACAGEGGEGVEGGKAIAKGESRGWLQIQMNGIIRRANRARIMYVTVFYFFFLVARFSRAAGPQ